MRNAAPPPPFARSRTIRHCELASSGAGLFPMLGDGLSELNLTEPSALAETPRAPVGERLEVEPVDVVAVRRPPRVPAARCFEAEVLALEPLARARRRVRARRPRLAHLARRGRAGGRRILLKLRRTATEQTTGPLVRTMVVVMVMNHRNNTRSTTTPVPATAASTNNSKKKAPDRSGREPPGTRWALRRPSPRRSRRRHRRPWRATATRSWRRRCAAPTRL